MPSADSASKVIHHMQRSEKMLRAGHGLSVDSSIQRRLVMAAGPTALYSDPSFSLFKLADKRPLPEPRGALFDICTENFHYALPVDSVMTRLEGDDLGQLLSEPARGCPSAAAPGPAQGALPVPQPAAPAEPETKTAPSETRAKPPKQKEKKGKKEKEKKDKKEKKREEG